MGAEVVATITVVVFLLGILIGNQATKVNTLSLTLDGKINMVKTDTDKRLSQVEADMKEYRGNMAAMAADIREIKTLVSREYKT
jgi:hypothetical protein